MKRIISVLIIAVMLAASIVPSAFAEDGVTVTNKLSGDRYEVNITCIYENDGSVLVVVRDEEGNIKAFSQSECKGGIFTGRVYMPVPTSDEKDYLTYTVYLGHGASVEEKKADFSLPTADFYAENTQKLKNAKSKDEVIEVIDKNATYLGLDTLFFTKDTKEEIAKKFISLDRDELTAETLPALFDESIIRTYIYKLKKDIDEVVAHYEGTLSLINGENSMYSYYEEMTDKEKEKVLSLFTSKEPGEIANAKDIFNMSVLSVTIDNGTNTEVDTLLNEFSEYLGIEVPELSTAKTIKLIGELRKSDISLEKDKFASVFEKACKKIKETKPSGGGTSGGSSGGASSGGSVGAGKYTPSVNQDIPAITPATASFKDMANHTWAKEAVDYLFGRNIISGRKEGIFAPGDFITRAEFAKILTLSYNLSEGGEIPFTDIAKDHWSYEYISALYKNGITSGYPDNTFLGDRYITREEIALMLYRVLAKKYEMGTQTSFNSALSDIDEVSEYAVFSVQGLEFSGIIKGDEAMRFNPKNNATRAEVAVMIHRALQKGGENK